MYAAVRSAQSVHIDGTIVQGGKTLALDFGITRSGGVSGELFENGAAVTVLASGGSTYFKLTAAFLKFAHLNPVLCTEFCGRYVLAPPATSRQVLGGLNMGKFVRAITTSPGHKVSYAGEMVTGGRPAWLLQDKHRDTLYIAAQGRPYALRLVPAPGSKSFGSLSLSQWNTVQIPPPPPASQVVNPAQLTQTT
jgi:hypothetical protein